MLKIKIRQEKKKDLTALIFGDLFQLKYGSGLASFNKNIFLYGIQIRSEAGLIGYN